MIPSKNSKATGILRHCFRNAELRREVGNGGSLVGVEFSPRIRVKSRILSGNLLIPARQVKVRTESCIGCGKALEEHWISAELQQSLGRSFGQHAPRVMAAFVPGLGVNHDE
ncbi:unannotated protein [freshwater metagenome]|uniref:Unannotated protein n=1 Tax=freshwater metagenome TaxID=449393 RepID=A0A6J7NM95_9ZZZZ